jgi:periplasmic protein TonB
MFADSLLESPWADRSRRGWTTVVSFGAQMLGLCILLALPLLYTEGLPSLHLIAAGAPLTAPPEVPRAISGHSSGASHPPTTSAFLFVRNETWHPGHASSDPAVGEPYACPTCLPGSGDSARPGSIPFSVGNTPAVIPAPPKPVAKPPIVSRMMEGNLIYRVQLVYPPLARSAHIQGSVVLRAVISRTGTIENLQVESGHPLLVRSAMDAVRQWRYRPYILNGEPVEVETRVTVNFLLSGN